MTYQKVKEELVDKRKVVTAKELKKFAVNMFLMVMGTAICISIPVMCILGTTVALIATVGCMFVYLQMFDFVCEEENAFKKWNKLSKFWVVPFILTVGVVIALKYFKFL